MVVRRSEDEFPLNLVFWLAHSETDVSRHLVGPKVTLAVTDQSGLAE